MARYNTAVTSATVSSATTLLTTNQGTFTEFTGTAPYTVQLPSAVLFPGILQVFYNATSGVVTLSTSATTGNIVGPGTTTSNTYALAANTTLDVYSDGVNWVSLAEDGGPLAATTGVFSGSLTANGAVTMSPAALAVTISPTGAGGNVTISPAGTLTMSPSTASSITNTSIGSSNPQSGAFTSLTSNSATTFTLNTDATAYNAGGTVTITGGLGVSGKVFTNSDVAAVGTLTLSGTGVTHIISSTVDSGSSITGSLKTAGGLGVAKALYVGTNFNVSGNSTFGAASTNTVAFTAQISSSVLPSANNTYALGSLANSWQHVYTNDLHLRNDFGDYTIVEGEEDLFLYNNKNGKVYKFLTQEVDPTTAPPKKPV